MPAASALERARYTRSVDDRRKEEKKNEPVASLPLITLIRPASPPGRLAPHKEHKTRLSGSESIL